jgi:hypothetical protein
MVNLPAKASYQEKSYYVYSSLPVSCEEFGANVKNSFTRSLCGASDRYGKLLQDAAIVHGQFKSETEVTIYSALEVELDLQLRESGDA